ncbi:hypothetical protein VM1G_11951 [Cytospora mali]|uniref:Uncharacterized protein n=1 Tax=Cytospora mali TaxID=578113 RepID=A0A194WDS8_CYTMA|nr:hypothetical protein VM1G_11951 [Valsa mali]
MDTETAKKVAKSMIVFSSLIFNFGILKDATTHREIRERQEAAAAATAATAAAVPNDDAIQASNAGQQGGRPPTPPPGSSASGAPGDNNEQQRRQVPTLVRGDSGLDQDPPPVYPVDRSVSAPPKYTSSPGRSAGR